MVFRRIVPVIVILAAGCGSDGERSDAPRDVQPIAQQKASPAPVLVSSNIAPATAPSNDAVIAKMEGITITRQQVIAPLIEGYGLSVLLNVAQLELAKREVEMRRLTVSPQDITAERERTLSTLFKDADKSEYPQLLDQLLSQQHISPSDFDLYIQTNAYLKKIAEPIVKAEVTDDKLQESFKAIYGETVQVRHIQLANAEEVTEAKRRLATGEPFEQVARELSRNQRTAQLGGELPPFSRYATTAFSQEFIDVAFTLKPGEVSDPVHADNSYHLIKLERRFSPKVVKFEDVKESLREDLTEQLLQARLKAMRQQLVERIAATLQVNDPVLAKQYQVKKEQSDKAVKGKQETLDAIKKDQGRSAQAATQPNPESLRPPATKPGSTPGATIPSH